MSFGIVFVFFTNFFSQKRDLLSFLFKIFLVPSLIILLIGFLQHFGLNVFSVPTTHLFPTSLFGHQNRTSEFIGAFVIIQLFYGLRKETQPKLNLLLLSLSLFYLYLLYTRSVLLGVGLVFLISLFKFFKSRKAFFIKLLLLTLAMSLLSLGKDLLKKRPLPGESRTPPGKSRYLKAVKSENIQMRLIRWRNTLELIQGHPLGIGPGNYEFGYLPYRNAYKKDMGALERLIVRSPHNGYLELTAELGIGSFVLFLILMGLLIRRILRILPEQERWFSFSILLFT